VVAGRQPAGLGGSATADSFAVVGCPRYRLR
jgi:hypothetical protein